MYQLMAELDLVREIEGGAEHVSEEVEDFVNHNE